MNFNIPTNFTEQDAINLFRNSGLLVEQRDKNFEFKAPDGAYSEDLYVWVVQNPYTKESVLLKEAFQKYLNISIKSLILDNVSKLEIYKIFEKCQDQKMK